MSGTIVLYGGSGGIGSALARRLRKRGFPLHLVGRNDETLRPLSDELDVPVTVGNVRKPDLHREVAGAVGDDVAGLVYAVGSIRLRPLARLTATDLVEDFEVNAAGAALAVQALRPALRAGDGASVVLFSTVAVGQGFPLHVSTGMAKGAVEGLTRSLAAELAPDVRVNAVAPSLVETPPSRGVLASEEIAKGLAAMHPIPRLGRPDDVAGLAAWLLSDDASWVTGQVMGVDGGRSPLRTRVRGG